MAELGIKSSCAPAIEPHQGTVETACDFTQAHRCAAHDFTLATSRGTAFTAVAGESRGRKVIRFYQSRKEYARAYQCCWGHYYNCNRTRIGMYCAALDQAAKNWFEGKVAELGTELETLPADRQEQLRRELDEGKGN